MKRNFMYDGASGVASSISGGDIFIYLCSAQLSSFESESISKEINFAEHEYMNMSPSLIELATPLDGAFLWNSIPRHIKESKSLSSFRTKIATHIDS